jgi:hypothetical protein
MGFQIFESGVYRWLDGCGRRAVRTEVGEYIFIEKGGTQEF